ncbi:MAG: hypothetical protein ACE149_11415 [Armatimonadota bacterium]
MEINALARSGAGTPVLVVWAGQEDLAGFDPGRTLYKSVSFALDPALTASKELNCFLFPRVYLLSASGRLRYASPIGEQAAEVIREVRDMIATGEQNS